MSTRKTAIIIGAGPAGLTAAYELLNKTDIKPVICEMSEYIGGITRTVEYKGNKMDIGGHRFFSKSEKITQWWLDFLPLQGAPAKDDIMLNRTVPLSKEKTAPDPEKTGKVMLFRNRLSRIFFLNKLFEYPLGVRFDTFLKLGAARVFKIGISYLRCCLFPIKKEKNLEDFFINRFGKELYVTFFKQYSQKVWGTSCKNISPGWGYQRVRGVSILKAITTALRSLIFRNTGLFHDNEIETSLIKQFMYPKLGSGQLWEEAARAIKRKGGNIHLCHGVIGLKTDGNKIVEVRIKNELNGSIAIERPDYVFSTMPVKDLIRCLAEYAPNNVRELSEKLSYRDFITVGVLLKKMKIKNENGINTINGIIPDNWVYIQEGNVKMGRIQVYNNWSPYMVRDINTVLLGVEYFCSETDDFYKKSDAEIARYGIKELVKVGFIKEGDVLDSIVARQTKAYPIYDEFYEYFNVIRNFTDTFDNLFLIGRNGMHRYNNMDHSMLTAMTAVDNIINGVKSKDNIWAISV